MEYVTLYGTAGFFMETIRNLNLNVEALKFHVISDIVFTHRFTQWNLGRSYFADLRLTFRQIFFLQD